MRGLFLFLPFVCLGCSLYRSDGREQLEKNALHLAAQANLTGCSEELGQTDWPLSSSTEDAEVYTLDVDMLVKLKESSFGCTYTFTSTEEMNSKTESAIALTETEHRALSTAN